ncbi:hypothetical protein O7627_20065 [Solwaraspora sp. WMMD1047]|uniref:hypothetical protein n=1 Tax=Solwaraspora sp. WMMD1047 TaxID=3016102 RepID=UPI0024160D7F|nr:hypothetical protein [Solwaraspora sp. WMMD1047]MDG4831579.1 hypothetical protein [Solwaraspora sp. WMMD1047]
MSLPKGDELKAVIGMIEPGLVVLLLIRRDKTSTLWRITEVYWLPPSQHEHFWKELS